MTKQSRNTTSNPFLSLLAFIGYALLAIGLFVIIFIFYALIGGGAIAIIAAFFYRDNFLFLFVAGLAAIVIALVANIVIMRIAKGTWKIHWPDIWPIGMY